MDVICAGMFRSCSTWQYGVASELVRRHCAGQALGYVLPTDYEPSASVSASGWRVLKSHEGHPRFGRALRRGQARAIYASRDVRDVVDSMLHKQAIDFSTFLKQGGVHQIVGYDRFWTAQPRTLHQRYDDLMTNPEEGVRQIAEHLEISVSPNEVEELVERFSLESTRERTRTMTSQLQASGVDLNARENALVFDPTTLLHWNHVRTGRGGGWRERIGPRDLAILGRLVSRWLVLRGYEPDDTWAASAGAREPGGSLKILQGNLAYQLRRASLAYPQASRLAKRVLRLPERNQAREIKAVTAQSA